MEIKDEYKQTSYNGIYNFAYKALNSREMNPYELKEWLKAKDMDDERTTTLISEIQYRIRAEQKKARNDMQMGGTAFLMGVAITIGSYMLTNYFHIYLITWGLLLSGAFFFIRGFANWNGYKK